MLLQAAQSPFVARLHQVMDQRRSGGEGHVVPLLASGQSQREGGVGLAGTAGAQRNDIALPLDPFSARQFQHQRLVQ